MRINSRRWKLFELDQCCNRWWFWVSAGGRKWHCWFCRSRDRSEYLNKGADAGEGRFKVKGWKMPVMCVYIYIFHKPLTDTSHKYGMGCPFVITFSPQCHVWKSVPTFPRFVSKSTNRTPVRGLYFAKSTVLTPFLFAEGDSTCVPSSMYRSNLRNVIFIPIVPESEISECLPTGKRVTE